jgi:hypothetical protein
MDIIYWAILGLGVFVAIWFLFVVPSERRHHERKLEMLQRRIDKRQAHSEQNDGKSSTDQNDKLEKT